VNNFTMQRGHAETFECSLCGAPDGGDGSVPPHSADVAALSTASRFTVPRGWYMCCNADAHPTRAVQWAAEPAETARGMYRGYHCSECVQRIVHPLTHFTSVSRFQCLKCAGMLHALRRDSYLMVALCESREAHRGRRIVEPMYESESDTDSFISENDDVQDMSSDSDADSTHAMIYGPAGAMWDYVTGGMGAEDMRQRLDWMCSAGYVASKAGAARAARFRDAAVGDLWYFKITTPTHALCMACGTKRWTRYAVYSTANVLIGRMGNACVNKYRARGRLESFVATLRASMDAFPVQWACVDKPWLYETRMRQLVVDCEAAACGV
jgi:hypothetical protein